jgi:hypothetical protein
MCVCRDAIEIGILQESRLLPIRFVSLRKAVHVAGGYAKSLAAINVVIACLAAIFGAGVACGRTGFFGTCAAELRAS